MYLVRRSHTATFRPLPGRPLPASAWRSLVLSAVLALMSAAAAVASAHGRNADIGGPIFSGVPDPVPATGVAFAPGGYLHAVFEHDLAQGAGSVPGRDFWIDRMLAREGEGGGFGDHNNWLFTRGRAAYLYTHQPDQPGFVGEVAYGHKTGHDALFRLQAEQGGKPLQLREIAARRRQTPSYFQTVFEDAATGVRLDLVKFITHEDVAVAQVTLSALDGRPHSLVLKAVSPLATHAAADAAGEELTGAFQTPNAITTVFPRLSGDGFRVVGAAIARAVQVPARGHAAALKVQLGLTTRELPASLAEYRRIAAQSPQQAYTAHVVAYNRWWADNIPYLDTPEDNLDKTLFYRWWLLRFNFLDAAVPGNDYQFPVAIEGVLGYDNAIVLTTCMFLDDLKYLRDPSYAYGTWLGAGEVAGGGKYVDNPGAPANWSNSYAQYLTASAWRSYQVHGGPAMLAGKLADYGRGDVLGLLDAYDKNHNGLIEYDWAAMTGNDADAVSFDWARRHGQIRMDRTESAYVWANAKAAAAAARLAGDAATAAQMEQVATRIRSAVLKVLWQDHSKRADSMGLHGDLLKHRQASGPRRLVDWKEINNYFPFAVGLMPRAGDADYAPKYVRALRLFADAGQYPIFPFYTANQADQQARGEGGSNNFSVINSTVMFRLLASALRDYPSPYLNAQWYRKLLYWNAWAHYIDGDNRYPDQNEFWAQGSAAAGGRIGYRSWIHHTQLGATNFTVIEDAIGLRPRSDGKIELYPIDIGWDHFAADNIRYRDRDLAIVWDQNGRHYGGKVPKGYSVYLDGRLAFTVDRLAHVLYDPARGRVQALPDAVNAGLPVRVLHAAPAELAAPEQVRIGAGTRAAAVLADAGLDVALPTAARNLARGAQLSASFTAAGFAPVAAVDGSTANEPFWGTGGSPHASDWIELDLGRPQRIDEAVLYFYRSSSPPGQQHGFPSGTRAGYAPPWIYLLQYFDAGVWKPVPGQRRDAPIARGNRNCVRFPAIVAQRLRLLVVHAGALRTGLKEIQLYAAGSAAVPAAATAAAPATIPPATTSAAAIVAVAAGNQPPQVQAWLEDRPGTDTALQLVGRVGDDGLPYARLALHWRVLQAPSGGDAIFAHAAAATTAVRFTAAGDYRLRLQADDGALSGHADLSVHASPRASGPGQGLPLQGEATASAEFTAGHNRVQALNDGRLPAPGSTPANDQRWGSWGPPPPDTRWLQYQWSQPQRITASTLYFWDDQPGGGVAEPGAWKLQYLRDGRWVDIRADYPLAGRDAPSRAQFPAVTTTALRAVLTTASVDGERKALGVDEWQVLAEVPQRLETIDVRTRVGQAPSLPERIAAWYADGSRAELAVTWPQLDPARLAGEGRIDLHGLAAGGVPAAATVWVRATEPGQITTVDPLPPLAAAAGQPLALPAFATVQYNDGSRERRAVQWPQPLPPPPAAGRTVTVEGMVAGRGRTGTVPVRLEVRTADAASAGAGG